MWPHQCGYHKTEDLHSEKRGPRPLTEARRHETSGGSCQVRSLFGRRLVDVHPWVSRSQWCLKSLFLPAHPKKEVEQVFPRATKMPEEAASKHEYMDTEHMIQWRDISRECEHEIWEELCVRTEAEVLEKYTQLKKQ